MSAIDHPVFGIAELLTLIVVGAGPRAALAMRRTCCFARDVVDRAINALLADPLPCLSLPSLATLRVANPLELLRVAFRIETVAYVWTDVDGRRVAGSLVSRNRPVVLPPSCALPVLRALLRDNDLVGVTRHRIERHAIRIDDLGLFCLVNPHAEDWANDNEFPWMDTTSDLPTMLSAGAMQIAEYWLTINFARGGHGTPLTRGAVVIAHAVHTLPANDYAAWVRWVTFVSTLSGADFAAELLAPVDAGTYDDMRVALDTMATRIGLPMMGAMLSIESALYSRRLLEPNFGHPPVKEEEEEEGEEEKEPATKRQRRD